ncbi:minor capsid protein [Arthrobacter sp. N1]|uniref:minor capsid protein n=1 Tax=Arthrobacter sp. N1 TaxID=619291 RepID=UPI003BB043B8
MGFTTTLLTAAAEYLHAQNVGAWRPDTSYSADDVAITIDQLHSTVNKAIALGAYPVDDGDGGTDAIVGLQLWIRGAPKNRASAKDIADRAFDALDGVNATTWAGIPIVLIRRRSQARIGLDANEREELSANYYIQLTRTGAHRRD